ncbi:MAG: DUF1353 domain-containing protein [Hylemonella sp.]
MNHLFKRLGLTLAILLAGCATVVGRPTITQLTPNPPVFLLALPLNFAADDKKEVFAVPAGFVTDLASIPRALWWWQGPHEGTMAPAIIHDFLYWEQPCTKDEADAVMYVAMKQTGMSEFSINRVYDGIRTKFADAAWEKNRIARQNGEPRFFSVAYTSKLASGSIDPKATLASIQVEAIKMNGVQHPKLPLATIKEVCKTATKEFVALRAL